MDWQASASRTARGLNVGAGASPPKAARARCQAPSSRRGTQSGDGDSGVEAGSEVSRSCDRRGPSLQPTAAGQDASASSAGRRRVIDFLHPETRSPGSAYRSEEHTSELQSLRHLVCRLLLEKKKHKHKTTPSAMTSHI